MDFFFFCLLNAVLFLRPAEIVPGLEGLPIYQIVILANILVSFPIILKQLDIQDLRAHPITFCVLGVLFAVPLSHIRHFDFWSARYSFMEFGKTVLYYLLLVAVIRNEGRLNRLFTVLLMLLAGMTMLSLLHNHGVIHIPQLESVGQSDFDPVTGERIVYERLRSTGIFNDPNDFAMILIVGIALGLHRFAAAGTFAKLFWLALLAAFAYALVLTKSRGGFIGLFLCLGVMTYAKWGWKRAAIAGCLMLPLLAAGFAMRNDGGLESGTGQSRIQIWAEGFSLWKNTLTFGIGQGMYSEEVGHVAHNSFVHCYVELGLFGGTMFFGCFYFAIRTLLEQRGEPEIASDEVALGRTMLSLAIVSGAAASMLSLSRAYTIPPYLVLGLATATIDLNGQQAPFSLPQFDYFNSRRLAIAGALFIVATFVFMRTMVRWS